MAGEQGVFQPDVGKFLRIGLFEWMQHAAKKHINAYVNATDVNGRPIERTPEERGAYTLAWEEILSLLRR